LTELPKHGPTRFDTIPPLGQCDLRHSESSSLATIFPAERSELKMSTKTELLVWTIGWLIAVALVAGIIADVIR
jgi:hypothetical protein